MAYRCGLQRQEMFAGLAALSATFPGPEELESRLPDGRSQTIFIAHGRYDSMVHLDTGVQAWRFLEDAGYNPEYHEYDMAHEIRPEVIDDLTSWLAAALPPLE